MFIMHDSPINDYVSLYNIISLYHYIIQDISGIQLLRKELNVC